VKTFSFGVEQISSDLPSEGFVRIFSRSRFVVPVGLVVMV